MTELSSSSGMGNLNVSDRASRDKVLSKIWATVAFRREDQFICLLALFIIFVIKAILEFKGINTTDFIDHLINTAMYALCTINLILLDICLRSVRKRPDRLFKFGISRFLRPSYTGRILAAIPLILAVSIFMPTFSSLKSSIELFQPFSWDSTLIDLDRKIHGRDAWQIIQPFVGYPIVTSLLSSAYQLWFMLIYFGTVWFAIFQTNRTLRLQFFLAYFLTWAICGMVLAVIFASVGPCFVGPLLGNQHFAEQMAYLHAVNEDYPLFVIEIQNRLLLWYAAGEHGLGRGITAMPSMHVALAFLYVLAMRRISKPLGWLFGAFCVLIMLGSVHLGYHYAVDGYVAIAVTAAIWAATGRLARRLRTMPAPMVLLRSSGNASGRS